MLGLHSNPGASDSAIDLSELGEPRSHLLNDSVNFRFIEVTVVLERVSFVATFSKEQIIEAPGSLQHDGRDPRLGMRDRTHD